MNSIYTKGWIYISLINIICLIESVIFYNFWLCPTSRLASAEVDVLDEWFTDDFIKSTAEVTTTVTIHEEPYILQHVLSNILLVSLLLVIYIFCFEYVMFFITDNLDENKEQNTETYNDYEKLEEAS